MSSLQSIYREGSFECAPGVVLTCGMCFIDLETMIIEHRVARACACVATGGYEDVDFQLRRQHIVGQGEGFLEHAEQGEQD